MLYYIILGFLGWILFYFIFTSPFFGITKVNIHGNDYLSSEDIFIQAGIEYQTNLFHFNTKEATRKLLHNPWIDHVSISKGLPGELNIEVIERQPSLLLVWNNRFYQANEEGMILLVSAQFSNPYGLYIISGLDIGMKKPGEIIDCQEYKKIQDLRKVLENIFPDQFYKIQVISADEYLLFYKENDIKVRIANAEQLIEEWYLLENALQKVIQEKIPLKEINMKFEDRLSIVLEE
ncbi:MAG: FtsQ-type POTRA domain-containing protein [Candidatus Atribacteria bacterium]|nr:FtsQ-type POTRA domain-containing protein [Candidatus Atribacteria bacterium]